MEFILLGFVGMFLLTCTAGTIKEYNERINGMDYDSFIPHALHHRPPNGIQQPGTYQPCREGLGAALRVHRQ